MPEDARQATDWIVLLAHGSRDPRWRRPFEQLRRRVAASARVSLAYLQLCEPTLAAALWTCRDQGAGRVLVVPCFMSGGGHLLRDVGRTIAAAADEVSGLEVIAAGAVGEEPEVAEAMARAALRLAGEG